MIIANIFQQLYNIVDTAVVGQLCGSAELAGVGSTASMVFLIVQVAMGASVGCSVVISQLFGAKRHKDTKTAIYTTLITMGVMGAVFTLVGVVFVDGILGMLSTPADIYDLAKQYLQIYFYGCIPMLLYNGITSAFNALGESKLPLYFLIFSSFANIGLDEADNTFTAENCETITIIEGEKEYKHKGYTIRTELVKEVVEAKKATVDAPAEYESRVSVTMAERTYTETKLAETSNAVDAVVLQMLMM